MGSGLPPPPPVPRPTRPPPRTGLVVGDGRTKARGASTYADGGGPREDGGVGRPNLLEARGNCVVTHEGRRGDGGWSDWRSEDGGLERLD